MSPAIRSLVIPVSDLTAAKNVYSALLGAPHTDQPYYVGYNVNGLEVALNPTGAGTGPVAYMRELFGIESAAEASAPAERVRNAR